MILHIWLFYTSCFIISCISMIFNLSIFLPFQSFYFNCCDKPFQPPPHFLDHHKNSNLERRSPSSWTIQPLLLQSSLVVGSINFIWSQGFDKLDRSNWFCCWGRAHFPFCFRVFMLSPPCMVYDHLFPIGRKF